MKAFIPIFALLFLFACDKNKVFLERIKLDQMIWHADELIPFHFKIEDENARYNLKIELRYFYEITFDKLPVMMVIKSPDGKLITSVYQLKLKDANGKPLGDASGDLTDLTIPVQQALKMKKGYYSVFLKHGVMNMDLPGIIEMGLRVEKAANQS